MLIMINKCYVVFRSHPCRSRPIPRGCDAACDVPSGDAAPMSRYVSVSPDGARVFSLMIFPVGGGYDATHPFAERFVAACRLRNDGSANVTGSSHTVLHSFGDRNSVDHRRGDAHRTIDHRFNGCNTVVLQKVGLSIRNKIMYISKYIQIFYRKNSTRLKKRAMPQKSSRY